MVKLKSIRKIEPELARCIEVDSPERLFAAGGSNGAAIISHNSVAQRNIVLGCILRPESWRFLGIDLKRVELSGYRAYSNVVLGIATTLEDALTVLRFAQQTMMKRYTELEQLGLNNFIDLPNKGQALMVMVDEAGELLGSSGAKTEEGKMQDQLKGEASMIIGSIARLGRAAGVHLIIATQRPDATLIAGETKANLGARLNCGRTDSNASSMILGNGEGTRVKANPRGRLFLSIFGNGDHGQGFFADPSWIDTYLATRGLNPDGTPITQRKSRLANITDMSQFEDADLDAREGIDNDSVIEKIRQEEAGIPSGGDSWDDEEDWGFGDSAAEGASEEPAGTATQSSAPSAEPVERTDSWDALELGKGGGSDYSRPEDDWDDELDDLIKQNFS